MVYKTLYGLIFALLTVVPVIAHAEIYRDLSFIPQYDNIKFDIGGSDINNNSCPGSPVTYFLDSNGYRVLSWQSTLGTTVRSNALQCDRNPIALELVDIAPFYNSSTRIYHYYSDTGSGGSITTVYEDINGTVVYGTNFPIATSTTFIDSSGVKMSRFTVNADSYSGLEYAIRGYKLGNRQSTYALIVTNENLDYIDTLSELYALIDSLSGSEIPGQGNTQISYTTNTRFTGLDITGTSSVAISAGHFLDSTEIDSTVPALNPTIVRYSYANRNDDSGNFSNVGEVISPYTLDDISTTTTVLNASFLDDGVYDLAVGFYNNNAVFSGVVPFPDSYIYSSFEIASGTLIAVGTPEFYSASETENPRYLDCSITNITNCFINALTFVFIPSDNTLNRFLSLRNTLENTIPFGYFIQVYDGILGINLDESDYLIENMPFQDTIFTPLKTGIATGLWVIFAFILYRRFKSLEF